MEDTSQEDRTSFILVQLPLVCDVYKTEKSIDS